MVGNIRLRKNLWLYFRQLIMHRTKMVSLSQQRRRLTLTVLSLCFVVICISGVILLQLYGLLTLQVNMATRTSIHSDPASFIPTKTISIILMQLCGVQSLKCCLICFLAHFCCLSMMILILGEKSVNVFFVLGFQFGNICIAFCPPTPLVVDIYKKLNFYCRYLL